ncbi:MAG: DUF4136 domain-containing protein [Desulfobacterales bacterium]
MTATDPHKYALSAITVFRPSTENHRHSLLRRMLLIGVLALLTAGCASAPRITTNTNPAADFASFDTYNFMPVLGTDRPNGVQTPLSAMLTRAMSREMSSRGYQRSDNPDLLINFFVNTERRMDVRQVPAPSTFHGFRFNRYATWGGYRTEVRQYTQGTLAIDLVDARQKVLAWEGIAQQRLGSSAQQITQEQVDDVVRQVMAEFNHSAR